MKYSSFTITIIIMCLFTMVISGCSTVPDVKPPVAQVVPKADTLHGDVRIDNYYWLREKTNPEVIEHLKAENAYTDAMMKNTVAFQEQLYNELVGRIKETDLDVPYREGEYYYYSRTEKGKQYPINCRKKRNLDAPEEILLNRNELAKDYRALLLGALTVSPDGKMLAYSLDTNGSETFTLFIKKLTDGILLKDRIENTVSVVWAMDNRTLFYTTRDAAKRSYRLYRHVLGSPSAGDPLLYEEKDELYRIGAVRSKDDEYVFLVSTASNSDEVRYLPARHPTDPLKVILPRENGHEYSVNHHHGLFYIITNKNAKNFRMVKAPVADPREKNWIEVLPHRADVTLEGADFFRNYFVAFEREKGLQKIRVSDLRTGDVHYIDFPEPVYTASGGMNQIWDTNIFRFAYQSFITPASVYDYSMDNKKRVLMKQTEVLGGYDPAQYQSERIYAKAPDGKEVPVSLVYKKGMERNGKAPLHLYGYGSYGSSSAVAFSSNRLSLLNRGIIFALAHVRGGGDLGR